MDEHNCSACFNRLMAVQKAIYREMEQRERAHEQMHVAHKEVLDHAAKTLDDRLHGMNDFREAMSDMAGRFLTRGEIESKDNHLSAQIQALADRVRQTEIVRSNMEGRLLVLGGIMSAIVVGITVLIQVLV